MVEDLSVENVILREVTTEGYDKLLGELKKEKENRKNLKFEKDEEIKLLREENKLTREIVENLIEKMKK